MSENGWVKIHRKMLDNPVVMKDPDHLAVWMYLLLEAQHKNYPTMWGGNKVMLKPGQLITGRKKMAEETGVNESKIRRILNDLKNDHQIDQQSERYGSLITIINWHKYQENDQQNGQQVTNKWPTSDQQVTTIQECKEGEEVKEGEEGGPIQPPTLDQIKSYWESHGFVSDPVAFFDHYQDNGWTKKGGDPVTSWRRSAKAWEKREKRYMAERGQDPELVKRTEREIKSKWRTFEPEKPVEKAAMPEELRAKIERLGKKLKAE